MKKHPINTLRATLYRLVFIPAIIIIFVFGAFSLVSANLLYNEVATQQKLVSELVAHQSEAYLDETRHLLQILAATVNQLSTSEQADLLRHAHVTYPRFTALYILDASGRVKLEEKPANFPPLLGYDLSGEPYFKNAQASDQPYFSDPFFSISTDDIAVTVAISMRNAENVFLGVLVGEMNLGSLQQSIYDMSPGNGNIVFITDEHGAVIAHPRSELVRQQANLSDLPLLARGLPLPAVRIYYDREWVIGSASRISSTSWVTICTRPLMGAARPLLILLGLIGLTFLLGLVLFVVIFRISVQRITMPIQHLASTAEAISEGREAPSSYDTTQLEYKEISALMLSFERMLRTINQRSNELTETNKQLALELSEHQRAERELIQYREHLEELVAVRTADLQAAYQEMESFSYSVSHDLRAPLRHIDGFSGILLESYAGSLDEEARSYLQRVRDSAINMNRLVEGLLQLSRLTRGELHMENVDLSRLVSEIAQDLRQTNLQRSVAWVITPGCSANVDSRLVRAMLENLLGNAWKFSSTRNESLIEFGTISIEQAREKWPTTPRGQVYFVRDNGVGFDMAYSSRLFSPFQRLHPETEFPGTGIGLATVQRIVKRHGGRIWVESQVNQGTTFYFTLS